MTATPEAEALFSELVQRHAGSAGIDRLSGLDREIVGIIVRLLIEVRTAPADSVARIAETINALTSTLPIPDSESDTFDITKLSDEQLSQLDAINRTARNIDGPHWTPPEPAAEREMGACETRGAALGRHLDQHCHEWRGRELAESERIDVMNLAGDIGYPANLILRNVWRPIFDSELQSAVAAARIEVEDRFAAAEAKSITSAPTPEPRSSVLNVFDLPLPRIKPFGDFE